MNILNKIIAFIKNIFNKKDNVKMLETPIEPIHNEIKKEFANSLKVSLSKKTKPKVETLTCFGDGLGIQNKIEA